jgi:rRNA processing protein Gar1
MSFLGWVSETIGNIKALYSLVKVSDIGLEVKY